MGNHSDHIKSGSQIDYTHTNKSPVSTEKGYIMSFNLLGPPAVVTSVENDQVRV